MDATIARLNDVTPERGRGIEDTLRLRAQELGFRRVRADRDSDFELWSDGRRTVRLWVCGGPIGFSDIED